MAVVILYIPDNDPLKLDIYKSLKRRKTKTLQSERSISCEQKAFVHKWMSAESTEISAIRYV